MIGYLGIRREAQTPKIYKTTLKEPLGCTHLHGITKRREAMQEPTAGSNGHQLDVILQDNEILRRKSHQKSRDLSCPVGCSRRVFNALSQHLILSAKVCACLTTTYQPITPTVRKWVRPPPLTANHEETRVCVWSYVIKERTVIDVPRNWYILTT